MTFSIIAPRVRLGAVALACLVAAAAQAAPLYHVEPADPDGAVFTLNAINADGVAAGVAMVGQTQLSVIVANGTYRVIDSDPSTVLSSWVLGINTSGVTAGWGNFDDTGYQTAVEWNAAGQRLEVGDKEIGEATGIADDGTVCGYNGLYGAVTWNAKGKMTQVFPGQYDDGSYANAINSKGGITGGMPAPSGGGSHPFIATQGTATDLGGLGVSSWGTAINAKGHIAGVATLDWTTLQQHPIWYDGTAWHDIVGLGGTSARANGINVHDVVVGVSARTGSSKENKAFVYTKGKIYQLDKRLDSTTAPGWHLNDATAINDSGVIVGSGRLNGVPRGFIATPVSAD